MKLGNRNHQRGQSNNLGLWRLTETESKGWIYASYKSVALVQLGFHVGPSTFGTRAVSKSVACHWILLP